MLYATWLNGPYRSRGRERERKGKQLSTIANVRGWGGLSWSSYGGCRSTTLWNWIMVLTAFLRWMVEIMRQLLDETGVQPATGGASQNWHTIKWLIGLFVGVSPPTHDPWPSWFHMDHQVAPDVFPAFQEDRTLPNSCSFFLRGKT